MKISGQTWQDSLRGLSYPFAVPGPIRAEDGTVLDPGVVTDLALFVSASTEAVLLYTVTVAQGVSATFSFADVTGTVLGTATVTPADTEQVGIVADGVNTGFLAFDVAAMRGVLNWTTGTYVFRVAVVPHVLVFSDPAWRRGIVVPSGEVLTGEVWLVGADGIQLAATVDGFTVHAYGDPYAGRTGPRRTYEAINGVLPDADGNINVVPAGSSAQFRLNFVPLGNGKIRVEVTG